ncbi:hypothetical protein JDV02_005814 [Purpureocillium takamizusanense]|uniref:Uncharacterized protein n=1 Tax=Purpureocillium takamizusanense TaxID=2060973 RepID=A0A9Q8VC88_9HYPO|nr:uncharacterized protein JDV02_005814 [Purpureocillium takamizusanense]UNI19639.1 hypothetical protein JDV02_005814 [Purpureocillium takamizusanense]
MMFNKSLFAVATLVAAATADYCCGTNIGRFAITQNWANAAMNAGGTTPGKSGDPHEFGGQSGDGAQLKFYGADLRCNEQKPKLFEFPVMKDGSFYDKNVKHGYIGTPARVVYLQDGKTLCGVMTHFIEDRNTHQGSGPFRVCDK